MDAKNLYLGVVALSALGSVGRADYNLPLFGLLYLCTEKLEGERRWRQQRFFLSVIVCSIVFDIVYICYWAPLWFSKNWQAWMHWSYTLSAWTMWMCGLTAALKIASVAYVFRPELMVLLGLKAKVDVIEEYVAYKYLPVPQR